MTEQVGYQGGTSQKAIEGTDEKYGEQYRVRYGSLTPERLADYRSQNDPYDGLFDQRAETEDVRSEANWEKLNTFEQWATYRGQAASAMASRMSNSAMAALEEHEAAKLAVSSPFVTLPLRFGLGVVQLFGLAVDVGAEVIERGVGLSEQYRHAKATDTMPDFLNDLGNAWRAASYQYNVKGYADLDIEGEASHPMYSDMPGAFELVKIRNMISEGANDAEIQQMLHDDLGALYYRGLINDLVLHTLVDPLNLIGLAKTPMRAVTRLRTILTNQFVTPAQYARLGEQVTAATRALEIVQDQRRAWQAGIDDLKKAVQISFSQGEAGTALGIDARLQARRQAYELMGFERQIAELEDEVLVASRNLLLKDGRVITPLHDAVIRFTGGHPLSLSPNAGTQILQTGASKWKPWTWFRLTPVAKASEFINRTADFANILIRNLNDPKQIVAILSKPLDALKSPQLGSAILSLEGSSFRSAVEGVSMRLNMLLDAYRGSAKLRDQLQAIGSLLGKNPDEALTMIGKMTPEELLPLLQRAVSGMDPKQLHDVQRAIAAMLQNPQEFSSTVKAIGNMFLDSRVPYSTDTFRLHAIAEVTDHAAQQAILTFGVESEKWFTRAANALKAAETLAFLRLNPGYPWRNIFNNEMTMFARGVWSSMNDTQILAFWERVGFSPERLASGFGPAEFALKGLKANLTTESAFKRIGAVLRGDGSVFDRFSNFISDINLGKLDTGAWSAQLEAGASRRAYTKGFMDFIDHQWRAGRGFDSFTDYVAKYHPGVDPTQFGEGFVRQLHGNLRDALHPREVDGLFLKEVDLSVNRAVEDLAQKMGRTPDEVTEILTPALLERLRSDFAAAGADPEAISRVVRNASQEVQQYLDRAALEEVEILADRAAARIKADGGPTGYLRLMQEQIDETFAFNDGHLATLNQRAEAIRRLPKGQQDAAWKTFFAESEAHFQRMFNRSRARYDGMLRAAQRYGVNVPDEALRAHDEILQATRAFHTKKQQLYNTYFRGKRTDLNWQRLTGALDQEYGSLIEATVKSARGMDQMLYRVVESSRPHMMGQVTAWRETVVELRKLYMQDVRAHYRKLDLLDPNAGDFASQRAVLHEAFNNERMTWMNNIHMAEREGLMMLETGRPFGTINELDPNIMRIHNAQIGTERFFSPVGGFDARVQQLIKEHDIPQGFAEKLARSEMAQVNQSIGGRLEDRLIAGPNPERFQNANIILRDAELAGQNMIEVLPRATDSIAGTHHRIEWLENLAREADSTELLHAARQRLSEQWRRLSVDELEAPLQSGQYVMISAKTEGLAGDDLAGAMRRLEQQLRAEGYDPISTMGRYGGQDEPSFLVPGMTSVNGRRIGAEFGQESILSSSHGLVYSATPHAQPRLLDSTVIENIGRQAAEAVPNQKAIDEISARVLAGELTREQADELIRALPPLDGYTIIRAANGEQAMVSMDFGKQAPWVAELDGPNGMVRLERYSPEGLTHLDPHDAAAYTSAAISRQEAARVSDGIAPHRLNYYVAGTPPEAAINASRYQKYTVQVPRSKIYDMAEDPLNMRATYLVERKSQGVTIPAGHAENYSRMERAIHEAGYYGIRRSGDSPNTVQIFETLNPQPSGRLYSPGTRDTGSGMASPNPGYTRREIPLSLETVRTQVQTHFKLNDEQADVFMAVTHAMARTKAYNEGITVEQALNRMIGLVSTEAGTPGRAMVQFFDSGQAIITALKNPDIMAGLHELGHVGLRHLPAEDLASFNRIIDASPALVRKGARQHLGSLVEMGDITQVQARVAMNKKTGSLYERAVEAGRQEVFAVWFETYLKNGVVDVPELKGIFEKIKDWMNEIYRSIKGTLFEKEVPDEMRQLFDRMLGSDLPREPVGNPLPGIPATRIDDLIPDQPMVGTGLDQLWWSDGNVLMGEMEQSMLRQLGEQPLRANNFGDDVQGVLRGYMDHVKGQMTDTHMAGQKHAEILRDSALLNYQRRTHFDHAVGHIMPFQFWTTHTAWNWLLWSGDKPYFVSSFLRAKQYMELAGRDDMPARFRGYMATPLAKLPFVPEWLGPIYTNPLRVGLPFDFWTQPFDQLVDQGYDVAGRADAILRRMVEEQKISRLEYQVAINNRTGPIWEEALEAAQQNTEAFDTFDAFQAIMSPHAPLVWAWHMARGTPEKIGPFIPATRTIKGITALLGVPGGVNIEAGVRRTLGLPEFDQWEEYRGDRMVSSMVASREVSVADGEQAMLTHNGEVWEEAMRRAGIEYGVLALGSSFGIPLRAYPPGEERARELVDEMYRVYERGNSAEIGRFWDENPEVKGRLALFDEPEERMRQFLKDQIWSLWNDMTGLDRRAVTDALGEQFETQFLDKETRDYDSISNDTLATWAGMMNGNPVGTLGRTEGQFVQRPPEHIANRAEAYYAERNRLYGATDVFELQNQYFKLQQGNARSRFKAEHPILDDYWRWRRDWLKRNPDVAPYLDEDFQPNYKSEQELIEAETGQPHLTWVEWSHVMQPPLFRLMSDHMRTGAPMASVEFEELEFLAQQMGTDVDTMLFNLGQSWAEYQAGQ